tara:strand:+ start:190 stop:414 length:225 start_codon:yes stop_codon:yes gene_type:complete
MKSIASLLLEVSKLSNDNTIIQQINEPKYVLEVKHMKSGSSLVLCISKLRVSGDNLGEVMDELRLALADYLTME